MVGDRGARPLSAFKYKAFISYSWADRAWGGWLHRALETYRTPAVLVGRSTPLGPVPKTLHPIFKDREEEAAGASISASIEAAMRTSEFLIVVCSPRSAQSTWVNREVAFFKRHRDPQKILAVIVDGEPGASAVQGREANECFPKTLLFAVDEDLSPTHVAEDAPLAADARDSGDGKRGARLKLAAALLGLGLGELVRRDERRRTVVRRIVTAATLGIATITSGLAVFAFNQRDAAVQARNDALSARKEAEFQRDQAQGLVEFMVTDLRKRLDAVGRLDVLESVGTRLAEFYAEQDLESLDADALGRRSRVQLLLGEVDNTRGNLDAALQRYREAAGATAELLRRDPHTAQRLFDHAQSLFWVGQIAWQRGDAATARDYWTQYHAQAEQLLALEPDNADWQAELMYAHSNLGTLDLDAGSAQAAEAHFRESLALAKVVYGETPTTAQSAIELGQSYSWLAEALMVQAEVEAAREVRLAELAVYAEIPGGGADHAALGNNAAIAHYTLADTLIAGGNVTEALAQAVIAVKLAAALLAQEPQNLTLADRAALANTILGEARMHARLPQQARESLLAAQALADRLLSKDGTVVRWRGKVGALPSLMLARLDESEQRVAAALAGYATLIEQLGPMIEAGTPEPAVVRIYASALAGQARLSDRHSDNWVKIVAMLGRASEQHPPRTRMVLAEALAYSGDISGVRGIATTLQASGYRHPDLAALLVKLPVLESQ